MPSLLHTQRQGGGRLKVVANEASRGLTKAQEASRGPPELSSCSTCEGDTSPATFVVHAGHSPSADQARNVDMLIATRQQLMPSTTANMSATAAVRDIMRAGQ